MRTIPVVKTLRVTDKGTAAY